MVKHSLIALLALCTGCMAPWDQVAVDTDPLTSTGTPDETAGDTASEQVILTVASAITEDTVWPEGAAVYLQGLVYVETGAHLRIEPGVTVHGEDGSALVVTRDGLITARGREDAPIVFTSSKPVGSRAPGDWGGLVLLGDAPVNLSDAVVEGVPDGETRGAFGGNDPTSNCGVLEYVRVEFTGFEVYTDNELNGITMAGCGSKTIVRHVQSHKGKDDGIEIFGGTVDIKNVVITEAGDDGLDIDMGWTGRGQFIVIAQGSWDGDNGIEADNLEDAHDSLPRSQPTLYNLTILGADDPKVSQRGMNLRRGVGLHLRNALLGWFPKEAFDLRDEASDRIATGELTMDGVALWTIGADGETWFTDESAPADDDDGGLDELTWLQGIADAGTVILGEDPLLSGVPDGHPRGGWMPGAGSPLSDGVRLPEQEFFDQGADYIGAVRPGATKGWWEGWAAFPQD